MHDSFAPVQALCVLEPTPKLACGQAGLALLPHVKGGKTVRQDVFFEVQEVLQVLSSLQHKVPRIVSYNNDVIGSFGAWMPSRCEDCTLSGFQHAGKCARSWLKWCQQFNRLLQGCMML